MLGSPFDVDLGLTFKQSRTYRSHRRPLSTNVNTYQPESPPFLSRRLSDQQEHSSRRAEDITSDLTRTITQRSLARDKAMSSHPAEDTTQRTRNGAALRPSPLTPRSATLPDTGPDNSFHTRRRSSITDQNSTPPTRSSTYRTSGTGQNYATTTVTTVSSSPKRSGGGAQINDTASTTVVQREAHPVLHAALSKSRPFLNSEVYRALETAATDAMALSSMMGSSGQPGPISSGASAIGSASNLTDRQLRRKADSVCRSLTELCVALGEDVAQSRPTQTSHSNRPSISHSHGQQQQQEPSLQEGPSTPTTVNKSYNVFTSQRRSSVVADPSVHKTSASNQSSPSRTMSKFEERRNTLLHGSALPSPRASGSGPTTPQDTSANRRSSLLVSRSRRALTEEPEEVAGRRSSLLLRSRRGGTEEPEEGRQTSLLMRNRRGTVGEGDDDVRMSAPSRAYTEVNSTRGAPAREYTEIATSSRLPTRDYLSHGSSAAQEASPQTSTLPRRRYVSTNTTGSRLVTPSTTTSTALPTRKYFDRQPAPERDDTMGAERRGEHRYSLGATTTVNRGLSLKSKRQSMISSLPTAAAAASYR